MRQVHEEKEKEEQKEKEKTMQMRAMMMTGMTGGIADRGTHALPKVFPSPSCH